MTEPHTILVTGAAGRIGTRLVSFLQGRYALRLADLDVSGLAAGEETEVMEMDIRDANDCRLACTGVQTVVHLAADPSVKADFMGSLLHTNVVGTYNMFEAARDEGCQRFIFASSINTMSGYPLDFQAHVDSPIRPGNMYGVSKCFGEATAAYFAQMEGLPSIVVRIGHYLEDPPPDKMTARNLSAYLSPGDLCRLFLACIEAKPMQFAIVHGVSNNRFKLLDLTSTPVDYAPQDDAFDLARIGLADT